MLNTKSYIKMQSRTTQPLYYQTCYMFAAKALKMSEKFCQIIQSKGKDWTSTSFYILIR